MLAQCASGNGASQGVLQVCCGTMSSGDKPLQELLRPDLGAVIEDPALSSGEIAEAFRRAQQ